MTVNGNQSDRPVDVFCKSELKLKLCNRLIVDEGVVAQFPTQLLFIFTELGRCHNYS